MAFKKIETPRGAIIQGKNGKVRLVWNEGCAPRLNKKLMKKQELIDSEVLRYCEPFVPKRTGALIKSGKLGTVIGSGEVKYIAPYARAQYYSNSSHMNGTSQRGGMWFERMKIARRDALVRLINSK